MTKEEMVRGLKDLSIQELMKLQEEILTEIDGRGERKLRLVSVGKRLDAMKEVRRLSGFGLKQAVALLDSAPCDVPIADECELSAVIARLRETGSVVELV